jgi:hypothetical protein
MDAIPLRPLYTMVSVSCPSALYLASVTSPVLFPWSRTV